MKAHGKQLHEIVAAYLNECKKNIDAEVYFKALGASKDAKAADSRNIYIIALEKQVKLLSDLSKKRPVDKANKKAINATVPEIIRRAIDDSRKRGELQKSETNHDQDGDTENEAYIRERELALKKLKNQFIALAEDYISKGDYQSALEEIRRIFIIDPENSSAKKLEEKIESLLNFQSDEKEIGDNKDKQKGKSFKTGKAIPYIIAFLVAANVIIFFITSIVSDDRDISEPAIESKSDYSFVGPRIDEPTQSERSQRSSRTANSLPDAVMHYREAIAVGNEIEDEIGDESADPVEEIAESTYIEDADIDSAILVVEDFEEAIENDTVNTPLSEERDMALGQVFVSEPESILRLEQPEYPVEAAEQGIQGDVIVRVLYDASGTVNVSFVESSDHPLLSESALRSARLSRFAPADTADLESPQWVTIPYRFRLSQ